MDECALIEKRRFPRTSEKNTGETPKLCCEIETSNKEGEETRGYRETSGKTMFWTEMKQFRESYGEMCHKEQEQGFDNAEVKNLSMIFLSETTET